MEKLNIKEFIEKLNAHCEEEYIYSIDDIDNEYYKKLKWVAKLGTDEHRWYILEENVYEVNIDDVDYYLGVWEVGTLKSEAMSVSDCDVILEFYEMERYSKTTYHYRVKADEE